MKSRYLVLLRRYLRPQWRWVGLLALLLAAAIALELVNPWILQYVIDSARSGGSVRGLMLAAVLYIGVALALQVVSVADAYVAETVGWTATNALRRDLTLHCLELDLSFHKARTPGELIERIDGDVTTLSTFFARLVIQVLGNGLLFLGVLAMLYRIDVRAGAAISVFALVSLLILSRLRGIAVPEWTRARQASAELFGFLEERLSGTEDVRANGAVPYVLRCFSLLSRALLRSERRASVLSSVLAAATRMLFALGMAVALGLSAYLYLGGGISLGTAYVVFTYTQMLQRPLQEMTRRLQEFQQAAAGIGRIEALLAVKSSLRAPPAPRPLPEAAPAVIFRDVSFSYEDAEPVLRAVSFTVPPGAVLGVLGRTGSGKTTLTRLLLRLYDPDAGSIALGDVDLREAARDDLRARIGTVTQEVQLFHATLRENLTYFDPQMPDALLVESLVNLGLWEWYQRLPAGLDTPLAAQNLSAGEAQLLSFARVFLRRPGLVILDEASSRLDPATERRVEQAIDRLMAGRTGLIIAHRLVTVARADLILILEDGRVVEFGPREALARDPRSRFAGLLRAGMEEALA